MRNSKTSTSWIRSAGKHKWSYNFSWMGPQSSFQTMNGYSRNNMEVKPDLIIETGIAHGGYQF